VHNSVSNDLLDYLKKDSILADITNDYFSHQYEDNRIVTFFETRKTRISKGVRIMVVDAKSAKLGLESEVVLSLDADHYALTRFQAKDQLYEPVGGQIRSLVEYCLSEEEETPTNSRWGGGRRNPPLLGEAVHTVDGHELLHLQPGTQSRATA
jgi:hypothetical protein